MSLINIALTNSTESLVSIEYATAYLQDMQINQYMLLVGLTVMIYDHLLTLHQEVSYIWRSKIGVVSVIFLANRYFVPILLAIDIYEFFGLSGSNTLMFCKIWTIIQSYLLIASYMSIHVLVAMRVHALYGGRRWIKRTLWISGSLFLISGLVITTFGQLFVSPHFSAGEKHQCVNKIPPYLWTVWLPSILFETVLFTLTMFAAWQQTKEGPVGSLYMTLFRDGILYFIAVALCTIFNLIVWAAAPHTLIALARYFSLAMMNVAAARLVLNLKSYAYQSQQYSDLEIPNSRISKEEWPSSPAFMQESGVYTNNITQISSNIRTETTQGRSTYDYEAQHTQSGQTIGRVL